MKCPLLMIGVIESSVELPSSEGDCLKSKCAFWDKYLKACGQANISFNLLAIGITLKTISRELTMLRK